MKTLNLSCVVARVVRLGPLQSRCELYSLPHNSPATGNHGEYRPQLPVDSLVTGIRREYWPRLPGCEEWISCSASRFIQACLLWLLWKRQSCFLEEPQTQPSVPYERRPVDVPYSCPLTRADRADARFAWRSTFRVGCSSANRSASQFASASYFACAP